MKEIGVLMKPAMSLAVRGDYKTNTRRIVNNQPEDKDMVPQAMVMVDGDNPKKVLGEGFMWDFPGNMSFTSDPSNVFKCPYGRPGDILWIREVHYRYGWWSPNGISKKTGRQKFKFHAGNEATMFPENPPSNILPNSDHGPGWYKRNSLFMPRSECRTLLKITNIRVERLQDISDEDAKKEGIIPNCLSAVFQNGDWVIPKNTGCPKQENAGCYSCMGEWMKYYPEGEEYNEPAYSTIDSFESLWDSINGGGDWSWSENPWVWVVEFKKI